MRGRSPQLSKSDRSFPQRLGTRWQSFHSWLETRWVAPAYSGWVILGLALFFFAAATNTMAGWLYAISGVMVALLLAGAWLPGRSLRRLAVKRDSISPVSVGESLTAVLWIDNPTRTPKLLLQGRDWAESELGGQEAVAIAQLPAQQSYRWQYQRLATRRGVYQWAQVDLRTAAPLGLFWSRRSHQVPARAIVYPTVLPLTHCSLLDTLGRNNSPVLQRQTLAKDGTEGVTRTLRPYRWGDPTRLIHWRTSARYGELRVRELETFTDWQDVIIALDNSADWDQDAFEQAVVAAASLYFYAQRRGLPVGLWTAYGGLLSGRATATSLPDDDVLLTLAMVNPIQGRSRQPLPPHPLVWLTATAETTLPRGSRQVVWRSPPSSIAIANASADANETVLIDASLPLQPQLQSGPSRH
ncbi:MAG: DUF58 domain-containing protein [Kaiparowitsia implicata GSE-PSE-MK54-09C]|nr:DUF58 domain-containing protein [Kaiparowitsia implicata GSE-PSE-MK54-09C]